MRIVWVSTAVVLATACGEVLDKPKDETCESAAQCLDPAAPYCVNQHCQMACSAAPDCTDPARRVCALDGACVGCVASSDCGAMSPVCDMTERSCRGCTMDSECSGGICVEAEGTCTVDVDVAFVTMMGSDTGGCTRVAPCATIAFALSRGKRVVHVLGGSLSTGTITMSGDHVLDGENTTLSVGTSISTIVVQPSAMAIVEGFRISAPTMAGVAAVLVSGPTQARLHGLQISGSGALAINATNSAKLELVKSHIGGLAIAAPNRVSCPNSIAKLDQNLFEMTIVDDAGTACELTVTRNRFESSRDGSVQLSSGTLVMENNLIIHTSGFNDSISLGSLRPGSTVRYNTLVNTTALPSDGAALSCDASVAVTSNVFAYNSGHPITGTGCTTRYSVFDDVATTAAGTGNKTVPIDQIFANRAGGDYHLAATSAAKAGAEPGLTMTKVDFEGKARPNPAGTNADSGAFEAP